MLLLCLQCLQVEKPKETAFIRISEVDTGNEVFTVASNTKTVTFTGSEISFHPDLNIDNKELLLELDRGVALPKNGGCASREATWTVNFANFAIGGKLPSLPDLPYTLNFFGCYFGTIQINDLGHSSPYAAGSEVSMEF